MASLSQGRTAAAQCGLFTYKSVPVIFEPTCKNVEERHTPCKGYLVVWHFNCEKILQFPTVLLFDVRPAESDVFLYLRWLHERGIARYTRVCKTEIN